MEEPATQLDATINHARVALERHGPHAAIEALIEGLQEVAARLDELESDLRTLQPDAMDGHDAKQAVEELERRVGELEQQG